MISPIPFPGEPIHVAYFSVGCMLLLFGSPFAAIGNNGLTSKVLSGKTQGIMTCPTHCIYTLYSIVFHYSGYCIFKV